MTFLDDIKLQQSYKSTENDATALNTSGSYLVDSFALCGSMRGRTPLDILNIYSKALIEEPLLATKLAYYTRDIRGGLGERATGRILLLYLAYAYPKTFIANLTLVVEYGRYDDLIEIFYILESKGEVCEAIIKLIKEQLYNDRNNALIGKSISLLAKWLPSANTSSKITRKKARMLINAMGLTARTYRKMLSELRAYLNIVEVKMTNKTFDAINYEQVPSKAMNIYREVFYRNDKKRFEEYICDIKTGKKEIKAKTLYPYDIVEKILNDYSSSSDSLAVLEEEWKALPNYVDEGSNFLIMADVSGSMIGRPMATAIGLALYFSERNKGAFANHFMTFSKRPMLLEVKGNSLVEKIRYIQDADWEMNTNLEAAFNLVLNTAIINHTTSEDFPTSIVVISDMEIDRACESDPYKIFSDAMKEKFNMAGYNIPNLVFWNVDARNNTFHANATSKNIQLVSGSSPSVFKNLCSNTFVTPHEFVVQTLNVDRYKGIVFVG